MARAGDEVKKLRHRVKKVDYLRDKEKQNGFAEMSEDSNDGECHTGKVIECITDKNLRWVSEKGGRKKKVC